MKWWWTFCSVTNTHHIHSWDQIRDSAVHLTFNKDRRSGFGSQCNTLAMTFRTFDMERLDRDNMCVCVCVCVCACLWGDSSRMRGRKWTELQTSGTAVSPDTHTLISADQSLPCLLFHNTHIQITSTHSYTCSPHTQNQAFSLASSSSDEGIKLWSKTSLYVCECVCVCWLSGQSSQQLCSLHIQGEVIWLKQL